MNNTIFSLGKHRLIIIKHGYFTIDQLLITTSFAASCARQDRLFVIQSTHKIQARGD
jgi:hypothetical protein